MTNLTDKSSKDEIISAACEVIDLQQGQLNTIKQKQRILAAVLLVFVALQFI